MVISLLKRSRSKHGSNNIRYRTGWCQDQNYCRMRIDRDGRYCVIKVIGSIVKCWPVIISICNVNLMAYMGVPASAYSTQSSNVLVMVHAHAHAHAMPFLPWSSRRVLFLRFSLEGTLGTLPSTSLDTAHESSRNTAACACGG